MKETVRRQMRASSQTPEPLPATNSPTGPRGQDSGFVEITASQVEWTFWITLLAICVNRRNFYWKVVLTSASLARISYTATVEGARRLPASCATFPEAILWVLWLIVGCTCITTCLYCFFLTPIHLYWSPID